MKLLIYHVEEALCRLWKYAERKKTVISHFLIYVDRKSQDELQSLLLSCSKTKGLRQQATSQPVGTRRGRTNYLIQNRASWLGTFINQAVWKTRRRHEGDAQLVGKGVCSSTGCLLHILLVLGTQAPTYTKQTCIQWSLPIGSWGLQTSHCFCNLHAQPWAYGTIQHSDSWSHTLFQLFWFWA